MSSVGAHKRGHMVKSVEWEEKMCGMYHEDDGVPQGVLWRGIAIITAVDKGTPWRPFLLALVWEWEKLRKLLQKSEGEN